MKVDMSPEAVVLRLKRVSQLRRLCLELGKMKPVEATRADGIASRPQPRGTANDPFHSKN